MEVGLAVGGAFLSSSLNVLFDRLAPKGDLLKAFQQHTHDVRILKKLRMTLLGLQAVLTDAENKQASNQYVSQWLDELRDAVDSAENLMEQVNYEALRLKVEGQHQNLQVSDLNLCLSDDFFLNIKEKLEDTMETLEDLEKQIGRLGLKEHFGSTKQETRTPSTSVVEDSDIFGRQKEKKNLIARLLSEDANGKNLAVVPIVGMGGLGKTTLANAVYNDERVKKHFGLKAWFCVSEPYDALRITKGLLQGIGSFDLKDDNNLNQLQVKLKESLKGKKFLVVLDDVWNDNYNEWDDLRKLFVQGDKGSKIIVTTRKESVALMIGNEQISMHYLSTEASWSLFKRHAFENMDPRGHPELEEVGKQIAAKCKGLPLALKTLAGMLRSKSEVEEWKHILRSEIWKLQDNDILPALMLSYNDLPTHLKRCFAYCAIYPKDYPFCKDQVIHLWIANGLVQHFCSGNQYFHELRSRSLFQMVPNAFSLSGRFLMHDLVNDLARIASSNLCIRWEENKGSHMLEQCRHMSYSMGEGGDFEKFRSLSKLEQLRTLLPINIKRHFEINLSKRVLHNILPRLTSLRALSLSNYRIVELPDSLFIKLKLLRFLDLSGTLIKKLPDSICVLYNLETLLLSGCYYLEELPLQMEKLINLRHLDISTTSRLRMPLHLSKLKSLQVLGEAKFPLCGHSGLSMECLDDKREAVKAKMMEKNHVEKLSLGWSESSADNSQTERDILDVLRPHTNIKQLQITGYRGTNFLNWLADHSFLKLVKLSLSNCKDCDSLTALGQLPSLKFLSIRKMHRITEVTEEFYGGSSSKKAFNSLKKLEFGKMPEWKQWHVLGSVEFPKLERLSIKNCEKLKWLPEHMQGLLPSLKELIFENCPEIESFPERGLPFNLQSLEIKKCKKLVNGLKEWRLQRLPILEELVIKHDGSDKEIEHWELPSSIQRLKVSNLKTFSIQVLKSLTSLQSLYTFDLPQIQSMLEEGLPSSLSIQNLAIFSCHQLQSLSLPSSPSHLAIINCPNLQSLSESALPSSLSKLTIENCHNLQSLSGSALPSSLSQLTIWACRNLQSLYESALPSSLSQLTIWGCPNLQSLSESALPSSLSQLTIYECPNLQSLPVKRMPSSLSELSISNCPLLTPLLQFNKGKYWPKIAQIPTIVIDREYL